MKFGDDLVDRENTTLPSGVSPALLSGGKADLVQIVPIHWQLPLGRQGARPREPLVEEQLYRGLCVAVVEAVFLLEGLGNDHRRALTLVGAEVYRSERLYSDGLANCTHWHFCKDAKELRAQAKERIESLTQFTKNRVILEKMALAALPTISKAYNRARSLFEGLYHAQKMKPRARESAVIQALSYQGDSVPSLAEATVLAARTRVNPAHLWHSTFHPYRFVFEAAIHVGKISRGKGTEIRGVSAYVLTGVLKGNIQQGDESPDAQCKQVFHSVLDSGREVLLDHLTAVLNKTDLLSRPPSTTRELYARCQNFKSPLLTISEGHDE